MERRKTLFINVDHESQISYQAPKATQGTYVLVCILNQDRTIQVGRLGRFQFQKGYYLYIGSAFGPGGVKARVQRHLKRQKKLRWHIDYLRKHAILEQVWYSEIPIHRECFWSQQFAVQADYDALIPGFGSSDCKCHSHLFYSRKVPDPCILRVQTSSFN